MERGKRALALYINYFLLRRTPTLVFSAERSGSVSVLHSLRSHGVFAIGAHYLSADKLLQHSSGSACWAGKHIIGKKKPAKVISLVRSPIENMLSTFARECYGQQAPKQAGSADDSMSDELSKEFFRTYLQSNLYQYPLRWFETEFQSALEIDVYQQPFDQQRQFVRFREKNYDVLLLRTELKEEQKSRLIGDFVGVPQLEISDAALAARTSASRKRQRLPPGKPATQTAYADKYKRLKEHLVIPESYLDAIVNSRFARHFFAEQERDAIRAKYSDNVMRG